MTRAPCLLLPVTGYPVTQWYGEHPENYERFGLPGHEGIDFGTPVGTPVLCSADGVVVTCRTVPGNHPYGKFIRVWHEYLDGPIIDPRPLLEWEGAEA